MELDELKTAWNDENAGKAPEPRAGEIMAQLIRENYTSKIRKITYPEITGSLACAAGAVYIACNFDKLHTGFLQGTGISGILLLFTIASISLLSLRQLPAPGNLGAPCAEVLRSLSEKKIKFYRLQKISILLTYPLLVAIIILLPVLFGGRDITGNKYFWILPFSLGYIFLLFFSGFVSRSYKSILKQTEEVLREL